MTAPMKPPRLPTPATTGKDAPVPPPPPYTEGERAFLRWLVRETLRRRRREAA